MGRAGRAAGASRRRRGPEVRDAARDADAGPREDDDASAAAARGGGRRGRGGGEHRGGNEVGLGHRRRPLFQYFRVAELASEVFPPGQGVGIGEAHRFSPEGRKEGPERSPGCCCSAGIEARKDFDLIEISEELDAEFFFRSLAFLLLSPPPLAHLFPFLFFFSGLRSPCFFLSLSQRWSSSSRYDTCPLRHFSAVWLHPRARTEKVKEGRDGRRSLDGGWCSIDERDFLSRRAFSDAASAGFPL